MQNTKIQKKSSLIKQRYVKAIYVSSYIPRKCGIATFINDLILAINDLKIGDPAEIIAMTDSGQKYDYPSEVKLQIDQFKKSDYDKAVEYINKSSADIVSLQHEFGLYGGPEGHISCCLSAGSKKVDDRKAEADIESRYYLLSMLDAITKPIVATFHTILSDPDNQQAYVMRRIIKSSSAVVAMTEASRQVLIDVYDCPSEKIAVISHGVPDFKFGNSKEYQEKLGIKNADPMILAAGLLGPGKGLEYIIGAMPAIIKVAPKAKLYIVGQTHPAILKTEGDCYRSELIKLVETKKITNNVEFVNRYLEDDDLADYFQATDFFVTAYSNLQQSASGTLAWAVGAGKICISTPYQYAKELLSDGAGALIKTESAISISKTIVDICKNPDKASEIHKKAFDKGHQCIWPNVAKKYVDLFQMILNEKDTK